MVQAGVELLQLPGFRPGQRDYLSSLKLRRLVRSRGIKIIHTHDIHGMIDGSICRMLLPGLRFVHTFHFGNYPHRRKHYQLIERLLWRAPDALIAVGHNQAELIHRCYGIPLSRLHVIWNGVDDPTNHAQPERSATFSAGVPVIGSISTLIPQKGLEFLLQTAAILRRLRRTFRSAVGRWRSFERYAAINGAGSRPGRARAVPGLVAESVGLRAAVVRHLCPIFALGGDVPRRSRSHGSRQANGCDPGRRKPPCRDRWQRPASRSQRRTRRQWPPHYASYSTMVICESEWVSRPGSDMKRCSRPST